MKLFERVLNCVALLASWFFIYIAAIFCWMGAELAIEGVVHIGKVDLWVAGMSSIHITKWIYRLQKKIVGERTVNNER